MKFQILLTIIFVLSGYGVSGQYYESTFTVAGFAQTLHSPDEIYQNGYINYYKYVKPNPQGGLVLLGNNRKTLYYVSQNHQLVWTKAFGNYSVTDFEVTATGNVQVISKYLTTNKYTRLSAANGTVLGSEESFTSPTEINGVAVDNANNVYLVGSMLNVDNADILLIKYNSTGTKLWTKSYNSEAYLGEELNDNGFGISINSNNLIAIAGVALPVSGYPKLFVARVNADGILVNQNIDQPVEFVSHVNFRSMKMISNGAIFLCTNGQSIIGFEPLVLKYNNDTFSSYGLLYNGQFDTRPLLDFDVTESGGVFALGASFANDRFLVADLSQGFNGFVDEIPGDGFTAKNAGAVFADPNTNEAYVTFSFTNGSASLSQIRKYNDFMSVSITKTINNQTTIGIIEEVNGNIISPTIGTTVIQITPCTSMAAPSITSQPSAKKVCVGSDVTFSVSATGTELRYLWKKGGQALSNNAKISGATTANLTITDASDSEKGNYSVDIADFCNNVVTSGNAALSFIDGPVITSNPVGVSQCTGTQAIFKVSTTGGQNVKYQWKKGATALNDNTNIAGSKTNEITLKNIAAANAGEYYCEVTADCGYKINSQIANLNVLPSTAITQQPSAQSGCAGSTVTFNVTVTGSALTFQWKKGTATLSETSLISGTNTSSLTIKDLKAANAGDYTCVVTGTCGNAQTSTIAALSVQTSNEITDHPEDKLICSGGNATFSISATGAGVTYQWKKGNTNLSNTGKFSGVTTPTLTITSATATEEGDYSCTIDNSCGNDVISDAARLSISPTPTIQSKSPDVKICENELAKMFVTVSAGEFTYQWKKNGSIIEDGSHYIGTRSRELFVVNSSTEEIGNYTCQVSSGCGNGPTSGIIKLEVSETVSFTTQPSSDQSCTGDDVQIQVVSSDASVSYQWKKDGVVLQNSARIAGVKTPVLTISTVGVADEGFYTCSITSACGQVVSSEPAQLSANPVPDLILLDFSCEDFVAEWPSLVLDQNDVFGDYSIFKEGSDEPLELSQINSIGTYFVVKKTSACADTVTWINTCIVTGAEKERARLSVSPNPSQGIFTLAKASEMISYQVFDMQGREVQSGKLTSLESVQIDCTSQLNGVYFLATIDRKNHRRFSRLIIQR